jgi:hypothetical protein
MNWSLDENMLSGEKADDKVLSVRAQKLIDEAREDDEEYSSEEVKWMFDES